MSYFNKFGSHINLDDYSHEFYQKRIISLRKEIEYLKEEIKRLSERHSPLCSPETTIVPYPHVILNAAVSVDFSIEERRFHVIGKLNKEPFSSYTYYLDEDSFRSLPSHHLNQQLISMHNMLINEILEQRINEEMKNARCK